MAILDICPGITVEILSNGNPLNEYADTDHYRTKLPAGIVSEAEKYQHSRMVSTYVCIPSSALPSASSAPSSGPGTAAQKLAPKFAIRMTVSPPYRMDTAKLRFDLAVDGIPVWTSHCARPDYNKLARTKTPWVEDVEGVKEGKGRGCTMRAFRFGKLDTTSEVDSSVMIKRQRMRMSKVGTITIHVHRVNYGKRGGGTIGNARHFLRGDEAIAEKALKGESKSHGTVLGKAQKATRGPVWTTDYKDGKERPLIIFSFLYRSEEALKHLLIIPRTPSPLPVPPATSDMSDAESGSMLVSGEENLDLNPSDLTPAQQRELAVLVAKMKRGNKSVGGNVKTERIGKRGKRTKAMKVKSESSGRDDRLSGRGRSVNVPAGEKIEIDLTGVADGDEDEDND
ncbi:hypothetical protein BP5796_03476 [Coleophoma crateriformis]|uniref:DUF7918 domain-containing protein n=1 Tax=Coleophoma crateriformis TaxID=565419 RepID=A0A3D8SNB8_9HELO|nr:hypothetical protein BP5796_03476 [Coleophoma crateriformis]